MSGTLSLVSKVSLAVLSATVVVVPASASAAEPHASSKPVRVARVGKERPCAKLPIEVVAGKESAVVALAHCDGSAAPEGVDTLSILARPAGVARPKDSPAAAHDKGGAVGPEVAPGIRRIDGRLAERLQQVVDHFRAGSKPPRVVLGNAEGKQPVADDPHAMMRSLRFRIDHAKGDSVTAFCKTLPETSCTLARDGHVRMDVRPAPHAEGAPTGTPGQAPDSKNTDSSDTSDAPPDGSDGAPALSIPAPLSPLPSSDKPGSSRKGSFFL